MNPFASAEIYGLRVLMVDDEIFIREMGSDVLSMLGCVPTVASDGLEAWRIFRNDPDNFDVIVSDYQMPEMTGIELAYSVHQLRPKTPIIISTGFASGFSEKNAEDLGVCFILKKPYVIQQLKDAITEAVSHRTTA